MYERPKSAWRPSLSVAGWSGRRSSLRGLVGAATLFAGAGRGGAAAATPRRDWFLRGCLGRCVRSPGRRRFPDPPRWRLFGEAPALAPTVAALPDPPAADPHQPIWVSNTSKGCTKDQNHGVTARRRHLNPGRGRKTGPPAL
jgi:hypothetical protein